MRSQVLRSCLEFYQKVSSHDLTTPQGAEKQLNKVRVGGGVESKHQYELLLFALAGDLQEQSLSMKILDLLGPPCRQTELKPGSKPK